MDKSFSIIGKNAKRIDAAAKATGEATFTVDVKLPGMLQAKFLRSPHAHAEVKSIDVSKAKNLSGVVEVITYEDLAGKTLHGDVLDDKVRYYGEAVAVVAAETEEIAEEALALIDVAYKCLPELLSVEEAVAPGAPVIWKEGNVASFQGPRAPEEGCSIRWAKGDVENGFSDADAVVENTLETHVQFHCCLEPHACVAIWNKEKEELTFWVSTQGIYEEQANLANLLGLPSEKVRVICTYTGGGFGAKLHNTCKEYALSALLSVKTCRPVRYEPSRGEEVITALRHSASFYYMIGAKQDGTLTAIYLKAVRGGGAHTSLQMNYLLGSTDYVAPAYFMCPNVEYEGWSVYTTLPVGAAFRGFGYLESGAALAQTMDILAEALSMDPLDLLMKNVPFGGYPVCADQGPLTTNSIREVIEKCAANMNWKDKWHLPGKKTLPDGRKHGIGIAHAMGRATLPPFVSEGGANIKVQTDGTVHLFVGISDMGQGQATGLAQIAAEALGVRFEDVVVTWGDSAAPRSNFQGASATTMMTGNATKLAAEDARQQLLSLAAPLLKAKPEELDIKNGFVQKREFPETGVPISEVVNLLSGKVVIGNGKWSINDRDASARSVMVSIAEVAVDAETGKIETIKIIQGTDCGRIISVKRIEGQLQAVLSGGIGFALMEDWNIDKARGGRILNANFLDYKLPTFMDTMDIMDACIIVEGHDPIGPYGARGMGEAVLSAAAPAILNAVYNAIGVRINSTPITPDKVLKALGKDG